MLLLGHRGDHDRPSRGDLRGLNGNGLFPAGTGELAAGAAHSLGDAHCQASPFSPNHLRSWGSPRLHQDAHVPHAPQPMH